MCIKLNKIAVGAVAVAVVVAVVVVVVVVVVVAVGAIHCNNLTTIVAPEPFQEQLR